MNQCSEKLFFLLKSEYGILSIIVEEGCSPSLEERGRG
jgi:hypothetical protein